MPRSTFLSGKDVVIRYFQDGEELVALNAKTWDFGPSVTKFRDGVNGEKRNRTGSQTDHYEINLELWIANLDQVDIPHRPGAPKGLQTRSSWASSARGPPPKPGKRPARDSASRVRGSPDEGLSEKARRRLRGCSPPGDRSRPCRAVGPGGQQRGPGGYEAGPGGWLLRGSVAISSPCPDCSSSSRV
jgi:hypothetical protein